MARIPLSTLMGNSGPSYPEQIARPFRQELIDAGFEQLLSPDQVDQALGNLDGGTALVVLNSVCGCAARVARPGALLSLMGPRVPDRWLTLFAGMEKEAVNHFREKYLFRRTPSSPNIALFKDGSLQFILERHQIERMEAEQIAAALSQAYAVNCQHPLETAHQDRINQLLQQNYGITSYKIL